MKKNNTKYYDSIASNYDSLLNEGKSIEIRKFVENYFTKRVKNKSVVLDFGGGTGLDLKWLTKENHTIIFCEPSEKMRVLAKKKNTINNISIIFLENDLVNFKNWKELNFSLKIDAVLSNFAVLNSIEKLKLLAEKLNMITNNKADLFFLVLYRIPNNKINPFANVILNINFNLNPLSKKIVINNDNVKHNITLHSLKSIRNNFKPYFQIKNIITISDSCFKLIHLKKEPND